jgi:hypothetical protein
MVLPAQRHFVLDQETPSIPPTLRSSTDISGSPGGAQLNWGKAVNTLHLKPEQEPTNSSFLFS